VNRFAGGAQQLRIVLHVTTEIAEVRLVPDLPVIDPARIAFRCRAREGCLSRLPVFGSIPIIPLKNLYKPHKQRTLSLYRAPAANCWQWL
jgi:hypothetical protein